LSWSNSRSGQRCDWRAVRASPSSITGPPRHIWADIGLSERARWVRRLACSSSRDVALGQGIMCRSSRSCWVRNSGHIHRADRGGTRWHPPGGCPGTVPPQTASERSCISWTLPPKNGSRCTPRRPVPHRAGPLREPFTDNIPGAVHKVVDRRFRCWSRHEPRSHPPPTALRIQIACWQHAGPDTGRDTRSAAGAQATPPPHRRRAPASRTTLSSQRPGGT
jgi:hypothetical protein